jgi:uncharacterized protein YecT (DUF1311 family)
MRLLIVPFVAFSLLALAPMPAAAQSQAEMNMQAGKQLEKADAELNKVYKQVLEQRADDPDFVAVLKEGQRAWLKYVELHLKMLFFVKEGENPREVYGSIYPMEFAEAKKELIKARAAQLRDLVLE